VGSAPHRDAILTDAERGRRARPVRRCTRNARDELDSALRVIAPDSFTFQRCETAWMISAARTASGRFLKTGIKRRTVTTISTAATSAEASERAPAPSFTADCGESWSTLATVAGARAFV
jgi:hypothetical protein